MSEREMTGLLDGLVEDGRPLLGLTATALFLSGSFAIFLALRREFLPHDIAFLGMSADTLCGFADCRVVRFMFHDRVAFGGALVAIAVLYAYLIAFPLRAGALWAWRALAISGALGFASFLAYLGYGYFDSWHGIASLALLPVFVGGLWLTRAHAVQVTTGWLASPEGRSASVMARAGRWGLLATAVGMSLAGATILLLGSTEVFVGSDLAFIGLDRAAIEALSPRLIPLIAHDRAGFGGGLIATGILVIMCAWYGRPSRAYWQALALAGLAGFGCAIGVHYVEGYVDLLHLAPAWAGAILFTTSLLLALAGDRGGRPASR